MDVRIVDIGESNTYKLAAARALMAAFADRERSAWPDIERAAEEVEDCAEGANICIGAYDGRTMLGWAGLRRMYEATWELHPLAVDPRHQGKGVGSLLLRELEARAARRGIIGIMLGTDDEDFGTSLSSVDLDGANVFREAGLIRNLKRHPYEFYLKNGYAIVGVVPNANGRRKPDIWMWKDLTNVGR